MSAAVVAADMVFCSGWVRGRSAVCQRLARPAGSARRKAGEKDLVEKGSGSKKRASRDSIHVKKRGGKTSPENWAFATGSEFGAFTIIDRHIASTHALPMTQAS